MSRSTSGGRGEARGRRKRKDVPFHRGGEGGNIHRYAKIVVKKMNQVPFHRGETYGRRKDVSLHTGGKENFIVMPKKLF